MEDFKLLEFDDETLTGRAETTYDSSTTANTEVEIIRRACKSSSCKMPDGLKAEYDNNSYYTQKIENEDGTAYTAINFRFELKRKE